MILTIVHFCASLIAFLLVVAMEALKRLQSEAYYSVLKSLAVTEGQWEITYAVRSAGRGCRAGG
jgi:hypothetical protein